MEVDKPMQERPEVMTLMGTEGHVIGVDDMASVRQANGTARRARSNPHQGSRGRMTVVSNMLGHGHGSNLLTKAWEGARQWQDEANAVIRHANYTTPADIFTDSSGATAGN